MTAKHHSTSGDTKKRNPADKTERNLVPLRRRLATLEKQTATLDAEATSTRNIVGLLAKALVGDAVALSAIKRIVKG